MMHRINQLINKHIEDDKVKENIRSFIIQYACIENKVNEDRWFSVRKAIIGYGNFFIENFTWGHFCYIISLVGERECSVFYVYFMFLIENNLYVENNKEVIENIENIRLCKGEIFKKVFYIGCKPEYFYLAKTKDSKTRYNLNCNNAFLRQFLIQFIENGISMTLKGSTRSKEFIFHFERSLYALSNEITSIEDFNYVTFSTQYRYYKKINWGEHQAVNVLVGFYLYLYKYIEANSIRCSIFSIEDGIDKNYLLKKNFTNLYDEGFRVVYFNVYDNIPSNDRWIVAPNGEEIKSISKKSHEYSPVDFSKIKDEKLKTVLKRWYWEGKENIFSKDKNLYLLIKFVQFIEKTKNQRNNKVVNINNPINDNYDIFSMNIIEYKFSVINMYDSNASKNSIVTAIKSFLTYAYDYELLKIEPNIFAYLRGYEKEEATQNPISKNDLELIVNCYKDKEKSGKVIDKQYFYITYLCLTTNLRINEVLGLKRNCLDETMKKGQYVIKYDDDENKSKSTLSTLRKGGSGTYKEENISKYTVRIIEEAIEVSKDLAYKADKEIGEYIFITSQHGSRISTISKDRYYRDFKKNLDSLPLENKDYTVYNMRDTYMTGVYSEGKKRGLTLEEIHISTGHKDTSTTIKGYRKTDIRDYLEAFYGMTIGDIDLKGEVVEDIDGRISYKESINEVIVSEGCGFCKSNGCGEIFKVDCLVCKSFITTIDRIEYFDRRIKIVDKSIYESKIEHDKEHLCKIKELLLCYLEKLYILKEEVDNND